MNKKQKSNRTAQAAIESKSPANGSFCRNALAKTISAGIALCGLVPAAYSATYYVSTSGNDSWPGTQSQPWRNINKAVGSSSPVAPGDSILVQPGTYTENVTLGKSGTSSGWISLKANGAVTVKDPTPTSGGWKDGAIIAVDKAYWNIEGFRVENTSWGGITLRSCDYITVRSCYVYRAGASGIIAMPEYTFTGGEAEVESSNIKVLDCTVEEAQYHLGTHGWSGDQEAISIWGVNGFEVARCKVFNGKTEGIDAKTGSRNGSIHHCEVYGQAAISGLQGGTRTGARNGGPAIYLDGNRADMFNIQVYNNVCHHNVADAIAVADESEPGGVRDIKIYNNVSYSNGTLGVNGGQSVTIASGYDVDVYMNTSVGDITGLHVTGGGFGAPWPDNIEVRNNLVANAVYETMAVRNTNNVVIDRNLFTTNHNPVIYNAGGNTNLNIPNTNLYVSDAKLTSTWRLAAGSPAIDAATYNGGCVAATDYDNQSRPQGSGPDIGADEYVNGGGTYYRIRNLWQGNYLYDNGDLTGYGSSTSNFTYHWSMETADSGYVRFRNRQTGDLMHVENLQPSASGTYKVQASAGQNGWHSAMWVVQEGGGFKRIQNRWTNTKLHIENLQGHAQIGSAPDAWYSARWVLETVQ